MSKEITDYGNYGLIENFNWIEDERLDPMFYERFLHFYGLKCLNDGKIYYLNPVDEDRLSLPEPSTLDERTVSWIIERVDTGYDDIYSFCIFEVEMSNCQYYWQLFISEKNPGEFGYEGQALKTDDKDLPIRKHLDVTELVHKPRQTPPNKFKIQKSEHAVDLFTTGLGFSEFSLPEDLTQMLPEDAEKFFGVELKVLGNERAALRIGKQIFGFDLIYRMSVDCYHEEMIKETWDEWKDDFTLPPYED